RRAALLRGDHHRPGRLGGLRTRRRTGRGPDRRRHGRPGEAPRHRRHRPAPSHPRRGVPRTHRHHHERGRPVTTLAPQSEESLGSRIKWTLHDYRAIVGQEFSHFLRQPATFAWQLGFPVVMVLLFVYVFGSAMDVTGEGAGVDYVAYAMPGLFAMTMAF